MKITIEITHDQDTQRLYACVVQEGARGSNLITKPTKKIETAQRMASEAITRLFHLINPPEISWILPPHLPPPPAGQPDRLPDSPGKKLERVK